MPGLPALDVFNRKQIVPVLPALFGDIDLNGRSDPVLEGDLIDGPAPINLAALTWSEPTTTMMATWTCLWPMKTLRASCS
jgi:hypothetical protein